MHESPTSCEIKMINGTLKNTKIKISAAPVDKERISSELGAAGFFNFSELRMLFFSIFLDN